MANNGQQWPTMANNGQQWPTMANNGYNVIAPLVCAQGIWAKPFSVIEF
jgi:hypothetical protein